MSAATQQPPWKNTVREHWMAPDPSKPEAMPVPNARDELAKKVDAYEKFRADQLAQEKAGMAAKIDEYREKVNAIIGMTAKQMGIEPKDSTDALIQERKKTHGDWMLQSKISQELKAVVRKYAMHCEPHQLDALEMIAVKMSRILGAGDPSYADHWDDIAGYARLGKQGHSK